MKAGRYTPRATTSTVEELCEKRVHRVRIAHPVVDVDIRCVRGRDWGGGGVLT